MGKWRASVACVLVLAGVGWGPWTLPAGARQAGTLPPPLDPHCTGVQPGAVVFMDDGFRNGIVFSAGFLFAGSDGATYLLVDGQLLNNNRYGVGVETEFEDAIDTMWPVGKGPQVSDSTLKPVMRARLRQRRDITLDVGWLRLDRGTPYRAQVCAFGKTAGVDTRITTLPEIAYVYGQGPLDPALRPRTEVIPQGLDDPIRVAMGTAQEGSDSGAPVLVDSGNGELTAVGISKGTAGGVDVGRGHVGTPVMRLLTIVPMAEKALGIRLRLLTHQTGRAR